MLTECIASVSSRHMGVITRRVRLKKKVPHCTQNELQILSACNYPRMAGKTDATYPVSLCIINLYFNLRDKFLFVQRRKIS